MVTGDKDAYRSPIKDYTWGSNQSKLKQARLYQLLALYDNDPATAAEADSAAIGYLHYIHGVNPLGLVYLTNMKTAGASHSASTMFHNWFAHGTRWEKASGAMPGPPPGYLVGGGRTHIIQRINVAPRPSEPRDTGAFTTRPPFHYAATITRRRSGSRRSSLIGSSTRDGRRILGRCPNHLRAIKPITLALWPDTFIEPSNFLVSRSCHCGLKRYQSMCFS
jgi:hypothetical protein